MGQELFQQACKLDLEGIISKSLSGRYEEGARRDWVKSKCRPRQEFVVCGYTPPKSSLPGFSSMILGSYENGKWINRGKVGTGFREKERIDLMKRFQNLATQKPLFVIPDKDVVWIEPSLVVEIEFAELTRDRVIRQGSFIALREDKVPEDVHLDGVQSASCDGQDVKILGMKISHPERVVFPAEQISKLEVVRYYERVGHLMLPFVANRPLSILRAPAGLTGELFFQKSFPSHLPDHAVVLEQAKATVDASFQPKLVWKGEAVPAGEIEKPEKRFEEFDTDGFTGRRVRHKFSQT